MSKRTAKLSAQEYCDNTIQQLGQGEYKLLGKYLNSDTYLTIQHHSCGQTFSTTLGLFKSGKRCPHCTAHNTHSL